MKRTILPIVEGHSEVEALPVLLRRVSHVENQCFGVGVAKPFRVPKSRMLKTGELEKAVKAAVQTRRNVDAVLLVLDADDDDPSRLLAQLQDRLGACCPLPSAVGIAVRELEGWFLGAKESLRGCRGIRQDARSPDDPEQIRNAKARLTLNMTRERRYVGVDDQPAFAATFDIKMAAEGCPSFGCFLREVMRLADEVSGVVG